MASRSARESRRPEARLQRPAARKIDAEDDEDERVGDQAPEDEGDAEGERIE